uniref:Uncharacterized protein n=1 Tax=Lactuca sativa TaxID=4236 RepID=A0A9R1WJU8_LACSA|nr:hypothetical protein LSAT_V11C200085340 [Lactuca sativa]
MKSQKLKNPAFLFVIARTFCQKTAPTPFLYFFSRRRQLLPSPTFLSVPTPPTFDLRPTPPCRPALSSDSQPADPLLSDAFQRHPAGGVPLLLQRATPPVSSFMWRLRLSPRDFVVPLSNTFTISFGDVKPKNEMLQIHY